MTRDTLLFTAIALVVALVTIQSILPEFFR
jgi:hypothetical protein